MIPFNVPVLTGLESSALSNAIAQGRFSGDGPIARRCEQKLADQLGVRRALLVPSCTHALEMAALLLDLEEGDEVILPSFTFVSTANAFALRRARLVFVDIDPRTMNIEPESVQKALSPRTKAIVVVHYAGVGCDMDAIMDIAHDAGVPVIEDAAQCIGAGYRGKPLGAFGAIGCFSFHETKNIHCGEGGAIVFNDPVLAERAEILREKGTNRSNFLRGQVDKYTWVSIGSSYLPSELNAAFLEPQLDAVSNITMRRLAIWRRYREALAQLPGIQIPDPPSECAHNAHLFWVKAPNEGARDRWIAELRQAGVSAPFHYVPLHGTDPGREFGRFHGEDRYTTREASRLLRLPLHLNLSDADIDAVIAAVKGLSG